MVSRIKKILGTPHAMFTKYFFDPWEMLKRWRGLFYFYRNASDYSKHNKLPNFSITFQDMYYRSFDRFSPAGSIETHYFLQDIWAAKYVYENKITHIVDVGSRLDGYLSHLLPFCTVEFIDIRPLAIPVENLVFVNGNITALPYPDGGIPHLSSLHVIEHIGLGRYGDPVDPEGHIRAARELQRVLSPGGTLILSTIIGRERLCFDGHRIFDPDTIRIMFRDLDLMKFCLIDDQGLCVQENASFDVARNCTYGCGIFLFTKPMNKVERLCSNNSPRHY